MDDRLPVALPERSRDSAGGLRLTGEGSMLGELGCRRIYGELCGLGYRVGRGDPPDPGRSRPGPGAAAGAVGLAAVPHHPDVNAWRGPGRPRSTWCRRAGGPAVGRDLRALSARDDLLDAGLHEHRVSAVQDRRVDRVRMHRVHPDAAPRELECRDRGSPRRRQAPHQAGARPSSSHATAGQRQSRRPPATGPKPRILWSAVISIPGSSRGRPSAPTLSRASQSGPVAAAP